LIQAALSRNHGEAMKQSSQRIGIVLLAIAVAVAAIAPRRDDTSLPMTPSGHVDETVLDANSALHAFASMHSFTDVFPVRW